MERQASTHDKDAQDTRAHPRGLDCREATSPCDCETRGWRFGAHLRPQPREPRLGGDGVDVGELAAPGPQVQLREHLVLGALRALPVLPRAPVLAEQQSAARMLGRIPSRQLHLRVLDAARRALVEVRERGALHRQPDLAAAVLREGRRAALRISQRRHPRGLRLAPPPRAARLVVH